MSDVALRTILHNDYKSFLASLPAKSVDLILTDPPYQISRSTNFRNYRHGVARFCVTMNYGRWDQQPIDVNHLAKLSYRVLRPGGTFIAFYDIWKVSYLADALIKAKFGKLRLIEWVKTNPVPLNAKTHYLTNVRETAVVAAKGNRPTFNSQFDTGRYRVASSSVKHRLHPTQKPLKLISAILFKHSNLKDLVVDPFVGSGTTAVAALTNGRRFRGCDANPGYVKVAQTRVKKELQRCLLVYDE